MSKKFILNCRGINLEISEQIKDSCSLFKTYFDNWNDKKEPLLLDVCSNDMHRILDNMMGFETDYYSNQRLVKIAEYLCLDPIDIWIGKNEYFSYKAIKNDKDKTVLRLEKEFIKKNKEYRKYKIYTQIIVDKYTHEKYGLSGETSVEQDKTKIRTDYFYLISSYSNTGYDAFHAYLSEHEMKERNIIESKNCKECSISTYYTEDEKYDKKDLWTCNSEMEFQIKKYNKLNI